ncbi:excisionase family DNA-binding protein [Rhodococcus aetherivorans]|uniref:excisionase family DNA-binding protein n=1 Tax=Rhodococcus aetherivorans TaxID=191292 RepID=UPI001E430340|nr:excisionase family DNA-binding protein [Rhodococcus aetherivorans]UGQ43402.1 excisionase family DNA-binding protein [Rhodococcus aetherivorans]
MSENCIALSVAKSAERLGVSEDHIRAALKSGELRGYRIGKGVRAPIRILIADLEAIMHPIVAR